MAKKPPTWKSKDVVDPYVETQGTNRKHHDKQVLGPTRVAPKLLLGFKSKNGYEYGQTGRLRLWIQAQKTGLPLDMTRVASGSTTIRAHTAKITSGSADGVLFTSNVDTPFTGRFTPKPYRSLARCLVFNTGSKDHQFMHMSSSNYLSVASGTAGTHNLATSWNFWVKPRRVGHQVAKLSVDGYSSSYSSNYTLLITDAYGSQYSASCDSTLAKGDSTAVRIGISDVSAKPHLRVAVFTSIMQAIRYGVDSSTQGSVSGKRLQLEIGGEGNFLGLELTSSVDGPWAEHKNITGGLITHGDSPLSLTASRGNIPRCIFSKASGSAGATKREYDLSIDQHAR